MTIIQVNRRFYSIPTCWDELSKKQYLQIIKILYTDYSYFVTLVKCFKVLANMGWYRFILTPAAYIEEWLYLTDFLFTSNTLTKNKLPVYDGMHGPADNFGNIKAAEYTFAENYYLKHRADPAVPDLDALDNLVAILYRPKKGNYDIKKNADGDARQEFNENLCSWAASHYVIKWPLHIKLAILHWYEGCRAAFNDRYKKYFDGGQTEDPLFGFVSVMRTVAAGKVHGNFKDVENTNIHLIFMELAEMMAENKK